MMKKLLMIVVLAAIAACVWGCKQQTQEERVSEFRQEYVKQGRKYLEKLLAKYEPDAKLLVDPQVVAIPASVSIDHCDCLYALEGTFLRNDRNIPFLLCGEGYEGGADLFVGDLPRETKEQILNHLCYSLKGCSLHVTTPENEYDTPGKFRTIDLKIGWETYLPVRYVKIYPGRGEYVSLPIRAGSENLFLSYMLPINLSVDNLDTPVPSEAVQDYIAKAKKSDTVDPLDLKELETYCESTWRNHLKIIFRLGDADFEAMEKDLLQWFVTAGISEAEFHAEEGIECWRITRSDVLISEYGEATEWVDHLTVSYVAGTDAYYKDLRYYDLQLNRIEP